MKNINNGSFGIQLDNGINIVIKFCKKNDTIDFFIDSIILSEQKY